MTSMSSFDKNSRETFRCRMLPVADKLYRAMISSIVDIRRWDKDKERFILDYEYAIDIQFTLTNGMILTGQEKFREFSRKRERLGLPQYSDVTVELYNDPILKVKGDWFILASQFYFDGFASEDETWFERWVLLDWLQVVLETIKGNISWRTLGQSDGRAKASFRYTPFDSLPAKCIIATSEG